MPLAAVLADIDSMIDEAAGSTNAQIIDDAWNGSSKLIVPSVGDISQLHAAVETLLSDAASEGFGELFQANSSPVELQWSEEKIRAVVPCLYEDFSAESRKLRAVVKMLHTTLSVSDTTG